MSRLIDAGPSRLEWEEANAYGVHYLKEVYLDDDLPIIRARVSYDSMRERWYATMQLPIAQGVFDTLEEAQAWAVVMYRLA